jgi:hypothetical protein
LGRRRKTRIDSALHNGAETKTEKQEIRYGPNSLPLDRYFKVDFTPEFGQQENLGEEAGMNDAIVWFIWIPAGVILLVLLINTFVIS